MKKGICVLLVSVFALMAAPAVWAEEVVLQYWMWDPSIKDVEQEIVDRFQAEHPDIKVELTAIAPKEYWTKMTAMAAAKKMPDVFTLSSGYAEEFATQGAVVDMTAYVEQLNREEYFWGVLDASFKIDGAYCAVPFAWVGTVLYYNQTLFEEAGVPLPEWGWTWNEFLTAAKALTKDNDGDGTIDTWGYTLLGRYAVVDGWLLQNDGDYLNREEKTFAPDENAIETITFLNDLIQTHQVAPQPKQYDLDGEKNRILFVNRQAAMITEGSWNIEYFRNTDPMEDAWDIAMIPRGPHWQEDVMYAWADGLTIASSSEHPDAAWEFIRFLINERAAEDYYAGKVPFYKAEAAGEAWDDWSTKGLPPEHKTLVLEYGEIAQHFFTKFWSQWRGYGSAEESGLNALLDDLFNGKLSVDDFLVQADKAINRVLRRAYKK